jgi:hypothetical protein
MSSRKVLHLASFQGNAGDILNHTETRKQFAKVFDWEYQELEIREYYWKRRQWDDLPELVNQYDLLLIGGGNFLELWPDTRTSTSIDLPPEIMDKIKVPVLLYAVGVDAGQGVSHPDRFEAFIDYLLSTPNRMLIVRNDGSKETMETLFHRDVPEVPDGGFFYRSDKKYNHWAINVCWDMPRFRSGWVFDDLPGYLNEELKNPDVKLVFVPHVFSDLHAIYRIIDGIYDCYRRTRISVAPHNRGDIFKLYNCERTLAMRFHANVASLAMGTPTVGLNTYPQVQYLYNGLGLKCASSGKDLKKVAVAEYELPSMKMQLIEDWLNGI